MTTSAAAIAVAAAAALFPLRAFAAVSANTSTTPVQQGQTNGVNNPAETITFEGQGSLNKIINTPAFGYLNLTGASGTNSVTLDNGPGGAATTYADTSTSSGALLNLASQNFTAGDVGVNSPATAVQQHSALRLEWHWNGTVDGSNDLINDQVGYAQATGSVAPQQGANRGPTVANPIYVNGTNHFDGTKAGSGPNNLVTLNGFNTSNNTGPGTYNTYSPANYDPAGNNLLGGTNRVQFSFSDYKTVDYSLPGTPSVFAAPGSAGYGNGNPALTASKTLLGIGVAGAREAYQAGSIANMPTTNVDPGTVSAANPGGTAYAPGPWNAAALDNISSTPVAANAVLLAANPGTGLSRLNLRDSQWVQTTGRLANGLQFNTVTRDADLGQRPSFATATGVDGTWAVGVNDGGDTLTSTAAATQHSLGTIKYSGKSSDTEVYDTIAQSRLGIGVLALTSTIAANAYGPVRSLSIDFTDQTDPTTGTGSTDSSKFIAADLNTISNDSYQAVLLGYVTTIKQPNATALAAYEAANPRPDRRPGLVAGQRRSTRRTPSDPTVDRHQGGHDRRRGQVRLQHPQLARRPTQTLTTVQRPGRRVPEQQLPAPEPAGQNSRDPTTGAITPNPNFRRRTAFANAAAPIYANLFDADNSRLVRQGHRDDRATSQFYGGAATNNNGTAGASPMNVQRPHPDHGLQRRRLGRPPTAPSPPAGTGCSATSTRPASATSPPSSPPSSAAKALYAVEPAGTTGANTAFVVTVGVANAEQRRPPVTYVGVNGVIPHADQGRPDRPWATSTCAGRFDGSSLAALARGSAVVRRRRHRRLHRRHPRRSGQADLRRRRPQRRLPQERRPRLPPGRAPPTRPTTTAGNADQRLRLPPPDRPSRPDRPPASPPPPPSPATPPP